MSHHKVHTDGDTARDTIHVRTPAFLSFRSRKSYKVNLNSPENDITTTSLLERSLRRRV